MECTVHADHAHVHNADCGHVRVEHEGHVDFLHAGHLHHVHADHVDDHVLAVSETNPDLCAPVSCECDHTDCGHESVPHGDHVDYLVNGHLHHKHGNHCDDHGPVAVK